MKTTHKPRQTLQQDHNTVKIQSCKKRHKTVSFLYEGKIARFVGRSERSDFRQDIGQFKKQTKIKHKQKIPNLNFFIEKKPMKTTHKPRQALQQDHNTKKIP
ncbi:MAG: hypothetical protein OXD54_14835 [Candidatus Poribacteria bacterium]|nr:hypothetical protein [Candidatus Poribacteria bacterium]